MYPKSTSMLRFTPQGARRNDNTRISFLYFSSISLDEFLYLFALDRLKDICPTARKESIDHGEARILRRRTDKSDDSFFYPGEEDILLTLHPSMDLIEKEYSLFSC